MNLVAYSQIDSLSGIFKSTGVDIPRLRGLLLMAEEEPYSKNDIKEIIKECETMIISDLVRSNPFWTSDSCVHEYSTRTDRLLKKYVTFDKDGYENGVKWNHIHGKKRKIAKYAIKQKIKEVKQSTETFNKYVGRNDVLCVHARIGGGNWSYYGSPEITEHPAYLERVDDWYDSTYCDIYLKINPELTESFLHQQNSVEKEK